MSSSLLRSDELPADCTSLRLLARLAISTNVHSVINKTRLGFRASLCFRLFVCKQYKFPPPPSIPKGKSQGETWDSNHPSLFFTIHQKVLAAFSSQNVCTLFLLFDCSQFNPGTKIYCLMSVHYFTQILSCLPVSGSSYTLLPE